MKLAALSFIKERSLKVLDLFTGSGCVALTLAHFLSPQSEVCGVDLSDLALTLASLNQRRNASALNDQVRVNWIKADLSCESNLREILNMTNWDLITANPPYILPQEWPNLPDSVRNWEDSKALIGLDHDGLGFYRALLKEYSNQPIVLEVGTNEQALAVKELLLNQTSGSANVEIWKDCFNQSRVVLAGI